MRTTLGILALASVALLTPVEFSPAGEPGIVRLDGACAQATSCKKTSEDYLCSTYHDDYVGYVCTSGCETELE